MFFHRVIPRAAKGRTASPPSGQTPRGRGNRARPCRRAAKLSRRSRMARTTGRGLAAGRPGFLVAAAWRKPGGTALIRRGRALSQPRDASNRARPWSYRKAAGLSRRSRVTEAGRHCPHPARTRPFSAVGRQGLEAPRGQSAAVRPFPPSAGSLKPRAGKRSAGFSAAGETGGLAQALSTHGNGRRGLARAENSRRRQPLPGGRPLRAAASFLRAAGCRAACGPRRAKAAVLFRTAALAFWSASLPAVKDLRQGRIL